MTELNAGRGSNAARVLLAGPPGAGKGTQGPLLADHLGVRHLSIGDLMRAEVTASTDLGRTLSGFMAAGALVPDDVTFRLLAPALDAASAGFILDGYPRTRRQAQTLDAHLERTAHSIDVVVMLDVPHDELIGRLTARGRADDQLDAIRARLRVHVEHEKALLEHYGDRVMRVDAAGTVSVVSDRVTAAVAHRAA